MFPGRVAFTFRIDRAVDAALGTDRVRTLYRYHRKKIDFVTGFGDFHGRRQTGESASNDYDLDCACHTFWSTSL